MPQTLAQQNRIEEIKRQLREKHQKMQAAKNDAAIAEQKNSAHVRFTAPQHDITEDTKREQIRIGEITLNYKQSLAVQYAKEGKEFCLIGAAGSGKTTASIQVIKACCEKYNIDLSSQSPAKKNIAVVAYTRRAARNSAKNLASIGASEVCMTAHRFLEYYPERQEYLDEDGNIKKTMNFVPKRTTQHPIYECVLVIVEEASMLGCKLHDELKAAAPNAIFLYIGDLNQLPPPFGDAILGYKLAVNPVVELTEIYRQALDSPIINFQHKFTLKGNLPSQLELDKYTEKATADSGLEFVPFKQKLPYPEMYAEAVATYMLKKLDAGEYDPDEDTILIPFNKKFGSIALNEYLAEELGVRRDAIVWEISAGFDKKYFAVGDFVMYEKAECTIVDINTNPSYMGNPVNPPSNKMTRNGFYRREDGKLESLKLDLDAKADQAGLNLENLLNRGNQDDEEEATTMQGSAIIKLQDHESGRFHYLKTAGEIAGLDYGYSMTIHKSQGSEWRKVWLIVHKEHANMLCRELLYTGMTRAKEKLTVLYSPQTAIGRKDSSVAKAVKRAKLPGTKWQDKVDYFKGKMS